MTKLILASASPRRREILEQAGYEFTIEVSQAEETLTRGTPEEEVTHLSSIKAEAVAAKHLTEEGIDETLVIGADTIVVLDREILGKPADMADAFRMLRELSGRTHQVYTGVSLIRLQGDRILDRTSFAECTHVTMRELSDEEIKAYIATGEPMDKAGAYGIQGKAAVFISGIQGDYYNVVGLPVCRLSGYLQKTESYNSE